MDAGSTVASTADPQVLDGMNPVWVLSENSQLRKEGKQFPFISMNFKIVAEKL